uniref:Uncharacterized protein n=2 Tax=Rhizophora mucronata TaxID=61149 RepID=A0A2P2J4T4_RHIMU
MESMESDKESNGSKSRIKKKIFHLKLVAPEEGGEGLPYAPEDWPKPGDTWGWRVGRRVANTGHYLDRYLYLPRRLLHHESSIGSLEKSIRRKKHGFASKLSVERYVRAAFPAADINAFFASFIWRIPAKQASINGNADGHSFSVLSEETAEHSSSDSQSDGVACKAGNKMCNSLVEQEEGSTLAAMSCDICCIEPHFCRDCCCILCCKTVNSSYGGYSYIKCEAVVSEGFSCGHVAHLNCALQTYMAGIVGGSIGLDAEYYCRRCDARTDLVPHVMRLIQTSEYIDSPDEIEKVLNIGVCILRGSQRTEAKGLQNRIELAMKKLRSGTIPEDIWKTEEDISPISTGVYPAINATIKVTASQDIFDDRKSLPHVVSKSSDYQNESQKLDIEIECVLQALQRSQKAEYKLAEERLLSEKNYLQNLCQQLDKERLALGRHTKRAKTDALQSAVSKMMDQIKQEFAKLKDMEKVANGFGRTSRCILKEHFGLEIED